MLDYSGEFELGGHLYFDHAVRGPVPRTAIRAFDDFAANPAVSADERLRLIDTTRSRLAALIGAQSDEIAFAAHTTEAVCIALEGISFRERDNVVGIEGDFPSVRFPLRHLARAGVEYRGVPSNGGTVDTGAVIDRIDERTRAVVVSWVLDSSGDRLELGAIGTACRACGALFVLDTAQGWGALAIDVERELVDVCAGTAHKWLLGFEGLGLLYVSRRIASQLAPRRLGRFSIEHRSDPDDLRWSPGARRYETGTLNLPAIAALSASLALFERTGMVTIERRLLTLTNHVAAALVELGFSVVGSRPSRSGIVAATHQKVDSEDLRQRLRAQGIIVSQRQGRLRVSPHFYNTPADVARFVEATAALIRE